MLSMIFIIREVLQLKRLGFRIDVASINAPDRGADGLTADEANEAKLTYYVKRHGALGALSAHVRTMGCNPGGYLSGLKLMFVLAGTDPRRLFYNLMYFTEALMVGVWMKQNDHHHLHAHLGTQAATVGLFVKRIFGHGFSITVHGPDEFYDVKGQYLAEKVAAADFVVCISFFARSQLMKLSPYAHWHKLLVSRLGIDPSFFEPHSPKGDPYGNMFEILCIGRLVPAKGQHLLIDAVGTLMSGGRPVRLRLVGDGVDRPSLERHAQELGVAKGVVFEGAVNQDRIRELYARADCFCIASFAEGIPVVLMEAMAMEIPCVTTHITGIPELIRNGVDGVLVAPSDDDALVEALAGLMDSAELRQQIGRSGRLRVRAEYDLERNVAKLAGLFGEHVGLRGCQSTSERRGGDRFR